MRLNDLKSPWKSARFAMPSGDQATGQRAVSLLKALMANRGFWQPAAPTEGAKVKLGLPDAALLQSVVHAAQRNIFDVQLEGNYWNFSAHLGTHFISQYFLFSQWFEKENSRLDRTRLKHILFESQLPDGSWYQVKNASSQPGDINATLFNYWALKVLGESIHSKPMSKARHFILKNGGIEATALFTKICLALFDNHSWSEISRIPYIIFNERAPLNYRGFSQWTIPHLMAIAYLRNNCVSKSLGVRFDLEELRKNSASIRNESDPIRHLYGQDRKLIEKILRHQQGKGSWGGYTLSTLLSMMALHHHRAEANSGQGRVLDAAIARGFEFVEGLYFKGSGAYSGALMDGKYWDTILIGNSLLESGCRPSELESTARFVLDKQQSNGGFPYGDDFEYAPDVDDTAEAILFLSGFGTQFQKEMSRATEWICSMQNSDGGWGAFDRNNDGNRVLRWLTRGFSDSVDLFDDSSADVTGHILEALGTVGMTVDNSVVVQRAVQYLKAEQRPNGSWLGRWGINYLYGTSSVVCGLVKVGESPARRYLQRSLDWLEQRQNIDGGYGESIDSYVNPTLPLVARSTPSQTAWVLLALCAGERAQSATAINAAQFLIKEFQRYGKWIDHSVVGTGHPGILYMNYPSYPFTFPLFALTNFAKAVYGADALTPAEPVASTRIQIERCRAEAGGSEILPVRIFNERPRI